MRVDKAVILAAGRGTRMRFFSKGTPKSVLKFLGRPLICHTIDALASAGVDEIIVVVGYRAPTVVKVIRKYIRGVKVRFAYNKQWFASENASSLLAAMGLVNGPFLLLMSDHIFSPEIIEGAVRQSPISVGVDTSPNALVDVTEATKVLFDSKGLIRRLGKDLRKYDAVDIGLFVLDSRVFPYAKSAVLHGRGTMSETVNQMIESGIEVRPYDVAGKLWNDMDSPLELLLSRMYFKRAFMRLRRCPWLISAL